MSDIEKEAVADVYVVQVMLLMTQYLQGTRRSMQTWTIHGIAVKAALQLGLHVKDVGRQMDPIEEETRLRTWQGCVALDRYSIAHRSKSKHFGLSASPTQSADHVDPGR